MSLLKCQFSQSSARPSFPSVEVTVELFFLSMTINYQVKPEEVTVCSHPVKQRKAQSVDIFDYCKCIKLQSGIYF